MIVGILDYGFGNIGSIYNAGLKLKRDFIIISTKEEILSVDILILPGVGSFDNAVESLKKRKLWESIKNRIRIKSPIIGICLGAQLLCESSEEGINSGLGAFKDVSVVKFSKDVQTPNMGWRTVIDRNGLDLGMFYFTHSFRFESTQESIVFATTRHDKIFPCVLHKDRFWAIQFHPEKSQIKGLKFLDYVILQITAASSDVII